jgi:hypothetical protein
MLDTVRELMVANVNVEKPGLTPLIDDAKSCCVEAIFATTLEEVSELIVAELMDAVWKVETVAKGNFKPLMLLTEFS